MTNETLVEKVQKIAISKLGARLFEELKSNGEQRSPVVNLQTVQQSEDGKYAIGIFGIESYFNPLSQEEAIPRRQNWPAESRVHVENPAVFNLENSTMEFSPRLGSESDFYRGLNIQSIKSDKDELVVTIDSAHQDISCFSRPNMEEYTFTITKKDGKYQILRRAK